MKGAPLQFPVEIIGYRPHNSIIDPEILALYQDYPIGRVMALGDFKRDLDYGYVPRGTLFRIAGGQVSVVKGSADNLRVEAV